MSDIQRYAAPRSLEEATDILRAGNVTIFAGGTDVMPQMKTGRLKLQPTLMNIRHIPELRGMAQAQGTLRIGALTTMTELLNSDIVRERFNALWQACDHFASDQLRNAGTIGGNICNASPAGDTLVPLLALDAKIVLTGKPNGALTSRTFRATNTGSRFPCPSGSNFFSHPCSTGVIRSSGNSAWIRSRCSGSRAAKCSSA